MTKLKEGEVTTTSVQFHALLNSGDDEQPRNGLFECLRDALNRIPSDEKNFWWAASTEEFMTKEYPPIANTWDHYM